MEALGRSSGIPQAARDACVTTDARTYGHPATYCGGVIGLGHLTGAPRATQGEGGRAEIRSRAHCAPVLAAQLTCAAMAPDAVALPFSTDSKATPPAAADPSAA